MASHKQERSVNITGYGMSWMINSITRRQDRFSLVTSSSRYDLLLRRKSLELTGVGFVNKVTGLYKLALARHVECLYCAIAAVQMYRDASVFATRQQQRKCIETRHCEEARRSSLFGLRDCFSLSASQRRFNPYVTARRHDEAVSLMCSLNDLEMASACWFCNDVGSG